MGQQERTPADSPSGFSAVQSRVAARSVSTLVIDSSRHMTSGFPDDCNPPYGPPGSDCIPIVQPLPMGTLSWRGASLRQDPRPTVTSRPRPFRTVNGTAAHDVGA